MLLQPKYLEVSLQESFRNPYLELAQDTLPDECVNDTAVMPQDVCNKPILDKVLEPVNDPSLQVHKNEMSCEPIKVHDEQQLLSQRPLEMLSQPLSSTTSCQDLSEEPEVLFLSVHLSNRNKTKC